MEEFECKVSPLISIHVPSWGTTGPAVCDRFSIGLFQSTFPRGERHSAMRNFRSDSYFNPRSLVGNDQSQSSLLLIQEISIHVPSWGTTSNKRRLQCRIKNFNPRSLVGNDGKFSQIFFVFLCNKYNFSTFYYPFSLFFSVIHVTFLIFVVRILPAFYVYF